MVVEYTNLKKELKILDMKKTQFNTLVEAFEKLWVSARNAANINGMNMFNEESLRALNRLVEVEQQVEDCNARFQRVKEIFKNQFNRNISLSNSLVVNREEVEAPIAGEPERVQETISEPEVEPINEHEGVLEDVVEDDLPRGGLTFMQPQRETTQLPRGTEEDREQLIRIREILDKRNEIKGIKATLDQLMGVKESLERQWNRAAIKTNEPEMREIKEKLQKNEEEITNVTIEYDYYVDKFRQLQLDFAFAYGTYLPLNNSKFDRAPISMSESSNGTVLQALFESQASLRDVMQEEVQTIKSNCDQILRKMKHYEELMMNLIEKSEKAKEENELVKVMKLNEEMIKVSNKLSDLEESLRQCRDEMKRKQKEYKDQFQHSVQLDQELDDVEADSSLYSMNDLSISSMEMSEEELTALALEKQGNYLEIKSHFVSHLNEKKVLNELLWKAVNEGNEVEMKKLREELAKKNEDLASLKESGLLEFTYDAFREIQVILAEKYQKFIKLEEEVDEEIISHPGRAGGKSFINPQPKESQETNLHALKEDVENWTSVLVQQLIRLNELEENLKSLEVFLGNGRPLPVSGRKRIEKTTKHIEGIKRLIKVLKLEHSKAVKKYMSHRSLYTSLNLK